MRVINPVIQTPPRSNADQYNSGAGQNAAPAAQQGFSDTLNSVGAKPVRKSVSGKASHADSGGDTLPAAGNHSPHTTPPVTPAAANAVAVNAGAPANPVTSSAASTAATVAVPVTGPTAKASAGAISGAVPTAKALPDASAAIAASAAAEKAAATDAAHAADASVGAQDAVADNSLPGPAGEIPQSTTAQAAALAATAAAGDGAPPAGDSAATSAPTGAPASQSPTVKVAAKPADTSAPNRIAGRGVAAMRAIYPTGNSGATSAGKSTAGGQDAGNAAPPESAATIPAAQVDTAAMVGAMQANSPVSTASSADADPAPPPANPSNPTAVALNLLGAANDVSAALPAMTAAAASAAQVVSTIAAGAAADKKSHDTQTQIASTSGTSSTSDAAGAAQLLNAQGTTHTDNGAVPTFKVNAPVDSPEFSQNVASHVSTMLDGNVNSAKLQVSPPALGPIEVRITIQGDHAQVWMASHSAMTRDALQDAAPQLREMLNSQGFAQVSVDISQRSFQERSPTAHAYEWNGESNAAANSASADVGSVAGRASSGMLDAYA